MPPSDAERLAAVVGVIGSDQPADRPFLLVIDALDEADFSLAPLCVAPGRHVHVVLSARTIAGTDWLETLPDPSRATVLTLDPLTREELEALLLGAGVPPDEALTTGLLAASDGDPLVVRLLIDDLLADPAAARATLADLTNAPPAPSGLDRYLERWWRQLAAPATTAGADAFLAHLAAAEAPLLRGELLAVAMSPALEGTGIDRVVTAIARFVVGDDDDGYALGHPNFRNVVERRLGAAVHRARDALITHCAGWATRADDDNVYCFRSRLRHELQRALAAHDPAYFLDALSWRFLRRKATWLGQQASAFEDVERGFLLVRRARSWKTATSAELIALRLSTLHEAVTLQLESSATTGAIIDVAMRGRLTEALDDALRLPESRDRVLHLFLLAELSVSRDPRDRAGLARRAFDHVVAIRRAEYAAFSFEEEEEMMDFWTRLPAGLREAGASAVEAAVRPRMVGELALLRACSAGPADPLEGRLRAAVLDAARGLVNARLRRRTHDGPSLTSLSLSPFERVSLGDVTALPALEELLTDAVDPSPALARLRAAWDRYREVVAGSAERARVPFRAQRDRLSRPAPPIEIAASDAPVPEGSDVVRGEVARHLAHVDSAAGEAIARRIQRDEIRAHVLLDLAAAAADDQAERLAREASDLLLTSTRGLGSGWFGRQDERQRALVETIARHAGVESAHEVIKRHLAGIDNVDRSALLTLLTLRRDRSSSQLASALDEAESFVSYYTSDPDGGWRVMTSIVLAAGADAFDGYRALVDTTLRVKSSISPAHRLSHEPFVVCSRALLGALGDVPAHELDEVFDRVDRAMAAESARDASLKHLHARMRAAILQHGLARGRTPAWTGDLHAMLRDGASVGFYTWDPASVHETVGALRALDAPGLKARIDELLRAPPFDRPSLRLEVRALIHRCWHIALGELAGIDVTPIVQQVVELLERSMATGLPQMDLPSARLFELVSPAPAATLLALLLPAARRGALVYDRYGRSAHTATAYAQALARARLRHTPREHLVDAAYALAAAVELA